MEMRYVADPVRFERMNSQELRDSFLVENLFGAGKIDLCYAFDDRAIIGSAVPTKGALALEAGKELACEYFAERREIGIMNIGAAGIITVDDKKFTLDTKDMLYIGKGSRDIQFESAKGQEPAKFYLVSYPAHAEYPTTHAKQSDAETSFSFSTAGSGTAKAKWKRSGCSVEWSGTKAFTGQGWQ